MTLSYSSFSYCCNVAFHICLLHQNWPDFIRQCHFSRFKNKTATCLLKYFRVHKPRDSILSWGSEFNNYEGVINWGGLLLFLGGLRLTLENFNKYGIRVDPNEWFYALFGTIDEFTAEKEYPSLFLYYVSMYKF